MGEGERQIVKRRIGADITCCRIAIFRCEKNKHDEELGGGPRESMQTDHSIFTPCPCPLLPLPEMWIVNCNDYNEERLQVVLLYRFVTLYFFT